MRSRHAVCIVAPPKGEASVDRGLAVVLTILTGMALSIVQACTGTHRDPAAVDVAPAMHAAANDG
jgi:hypothetical protein